VEYKDEDGNSLWCDYFLRWRIREDESWEDVKARGNRAYTFEEVKAMFPCGQARRDLKEWIKKARSYYFDKRNCWVKMDGARKDAAVPTPVPTTTTPSLVWRFPYVQEANRKCAFNAVKNIGYALPEELELADLRSIVDYLMKNNIAQVLHLVVYVLNIWN